MSASLTLQKRLGLGPDRVPINIHSYGNTTAATLPLATQDAVDLGRLKRGDLVLLATVGAGYTPESPSGDGPISESCFLYGFGEISAGIVFTSLIAASDAALPWPLITFLTADFSNEAIRFFSQSSEPDIPSSGPEFRRATASERPRPRHFRANAIFIEQMQKPVRFFSVERRCGLNGGKTLHQIAARKRFPQEPIKL